MTVVSKSCPDSSSIYILSERQCQLTSFLFYFQLRYLEGFFFYCLHFIVAIHSTKISISISQGDFTLQGINRPHPKIRKKYIWIMSLSSCTSSVHFGRFYPTVWDFLRASKYTHFVINRVFFKLFWNEVLKNSLCQRKLLPTYTQQKVANVGNKDLVLFY
jgi:hypothetical protein